jgi:hypothetical protein
MGHLQMRWRPLNLAEITLRSRDQLSRQNKLREIGRLDRATAKAVEST